MAAQMSTFICSNMSSMSKLGQIAQPIIAIFFQQVIRERLNEELQRQIRSHLKFGLSKKHKK